MPPGDNVAILLPPAPSTPNRAGVAQLVEHSFRKAEVMGSTPVASSSKQQALWTRLSTGPFLHRSAPSTSGFGARCAQSPLALTPLAFTIQVVPLFERDGCFVLSSQDLYHLARQQSESTGCESVLMLLMATITR